MLQLLVLSIHSGVCDYDLEYYVSSSHLYLFYFYIYIFLIYKTLFVSKYIPSRCYEPLIYPYFSKIICDEILIGLF